MNLKRQLPSLILAGSLGLVGVGITAQAPALADGSSTSFSIASVSLEPQAPGQFDVCINFTIPGTPVGVTTCPSAPSTPETCTIIGNSLQATNSYDDGNGYQHYTLEGRENSSCYWQDSTQKLTQALQYSQQTMKPFGNPVPINWTGDLGSISNSYSGQTATMVAVWQLDVACNVYVQDHATVAGTTPDHGGANDSSVSTSFVVGNHNC